MGEKTDNKLLDAMNNHKHKKVRMAYSLNDAQPVLCTMVSDQPFFYIDEEMGDEDDFFLSDDLMFDDGLLEESLEDDVAGDNALVDELLSMKNKIDAYNNVADICNIEKSDALEMFEADAKAALNYEAKGEDYSIEDVLALLNQSRMAATLIESAQSRDIQIIHGAQISDVQYDASAKAIFVSPLLSMENKALLVMRELRRAYQDKNDAMAHPLSFEPDQAVLMNRAQKADLDGAIIRGAWELRLAGEHALWNRLENSSYQDLARAFAREALSDFRTLNNGRAMAVLFETWFLSMRCNLADKNLINLMLSDYKHYTSSEGQMEESGVFDLLCRLGEQPVGKNYLSGYANMIVADTLFTDVRDRSNANFLWFIKFERTFEAAEEIAEQQLQTPSLSKTSGPIGDLMNNQKTEDTHNEKIHAFPVRFQQSSADKPTNERNNVIAVSFGDCGTIKSSS